MNPTDVIPTGTAVPVPAAPTTAPAVVQDLSNKTWFRGVPPEDKLNRMYGFAKAICNAAFISPVVRGDEASVFYLVSMAEDLGAQWTHGLRSIYPLVKRGKDGEGDQIRAGIQGDLALALLLGRKFKVKIKESTDEICTVWMARPDGEMEFEDSFTIEEAKRLQLTNKPNWAYKKDLLRWRAVMRVARIVAADVLGGMYLPEELEDNFGVSGHDRGGAASADGVFQDEARRQNEAANPFPVGRKAPAAPPETSTVAPEPEAPAAALEPPKAASPSLDKAPEPVKTNVTEMPKPSPPPESPSPEVVEARKEALKPEPPPKPNGAKKTVNELLADMTELLPTVSPETLKRKTFPEFLRGFFNVSDLKKIKSDQAMSAVAILPHLIRDYRSQFCSDPHGTGVVCGAGWGKLQRWYPPSYPADCVTLTNAIAIERYSDSGGADIIEFLELPPDGVVGINAMNAGEMRAFLQILSVTKNAITLKDIGEKYKVSLVDAAMSLQVDLFKSSAAEVDAELKRVLAEGIGGTASDEPAVQDDDGGELSLFDELG